MTNSKSTKRALMSSAFAILICAAMLIGTTFAWFTDTASTSVNKIQAGTLKVALEVYKNGEWKDAEGETLDFVKAAGHESEAILWEPGCEYSLPQLRIRNDGKLALKYKVVITGINGDAKLNEVIDWTIIGAVALGTEQHLAAGEDNEFTITGKMQTAAGNDYQGLSIDGIAITVYATQDTVEYDSNGNQYDKDATLPSFWDGTTETAVSKNTEDGKYHINTAAELMWVMNESQSGGASRFYNEYFVLENNIDLGGATITGFGNEGCIFGGSFDGKNHSISNFVIERSDIEDYAGLFNYYGYGTLENLTVKNATVNGVCKVGALVGGVYDNATVKNSSVVDCVVVANRKAAGAIGYGQDCTVENVSVKDTTLYVENTNAEQYGEVVGYKNTAAGYVEGTGEKANTSENVTIVTGTAPTFVSTVAALASALDNTGNAPSSARYILLTADIDGSEWTAIPGGSNYPAVMIDGNGHTIKNLSSCLFSSLPGRDYVFKNINFTNVNLNSASGNNAGIAVIVGEGQANGGGSYTITNCHINGGTINGGTTKYVGGFIGFKSNGAAVKFVDCSVNNLSLISGEESIGAFAGHLYDEVTFENCAVKGNTSVTHSKNRIGEAAKGGILVGTVFGADVKNCIIDSTVTVTNTNAAATLNDGLFGRNPTNAAITIE